MLLLILLVCCGGPNAVMRFLSGIGCLLLILIGLILLLCAIGSMVPKSQAESNVRPTSSSEREELTQTELFRSNILSCTVWHKE